MEGEKNRVKGRRREGRKGVLVKERKKVRKWRVDRQFIRRKGPGLPCRVTSWGLTGPEAVRYEMWLKKKRQGKRSFYIKREFMHWAKSFGCRIKCRQKLASQRGC